MGQFLIVVIDPLPCEDTALPGRLATAFDAKRIDRRSVQAHRALQMRVAHDPPSRVLLDADGCIAPSSVSDSADDRCLAFQIRGTTAQHRELYDVRRDPAEVRDLSRVSSDLGREIEQALESYHWQRPTPVTQDLEPALRERLRALGYGR
jgi:hypothetical protein